MQDISRDLDGAGGLNLLIPNFGVHDQFFPESFIGIEFCAEREALNFRLRTPRTSKDKHICVREN